MFSDNSIWRFNPFDAFNPSGGKLSQIVDRNGNTMTLDYDTSGRLTTIVDDLNRTNTVAYNSSGQLASVTDLKSTNTSRRPSGIQMGDWSSPGSEVMRVSVSRAKCHTQMSLPASFEAPEKSRDGQGAAVVTARP